ncbi:MAG: hypothetical protein GQ552_00470 [Flavobacteriaceae bacterium]|nr:hypothetical protein [Flavobacteriaceae bacterium]
MKKTIYFLTFTLLVFLLSSSKTIDVNLAKSKKKLLKGTWEVTNIRFVGDKGLYKANLFDEADSPCFNGSQWILVPNNGSGKFTLNSSAHCEASINRIHWSYAEADDGTAVMQFKFVNEKNKPLDPENRGYRVNIENLDAASFEMRIPTTYKGNPFDVVMTFSKVSDNVKLK